MVRLSARSCLSFHFQACVGHIYVLSTLEIKPILSICKVAYNFCRNHSVRVNMNHRTYNTKKKNIVLTYRINLKLFYKINNITYLNQLLQYHNKQSLFYLTNAFCHFPPLFQRACGRPLAQLRLIQKASRQVTSDVAR